MSVPSICKPKPRVPLTGKDLGDPAAALRVDELLAEGFGRSLLPTLPALRISAQVVARHEDDGIVDDTIDIP